MTNKRKQFVIEYTEDFNATQAAIRAGFSEKTARQIASDLLSKVDIQQAIKARIDELCISKDEVLVRLGKMARVELPTKVFINEYEEEKKSFETLNALEKLGKIHAMFVDKVQIEAYGLEFIDETTQLETHAQIDKLLEDGIDEENKG